MLCEKLDAVILKGLVFGKTWTVVSFGSQRPQNKEM